MVNREETYLDSVDQHGRGLRITFVWHRDRFAHTLALVEGRRSRPLLASLEGRDTDDWPASPPLQHVTMEGRGDGRRVALLVGMAGTSHWSASIEPIGRAPGFLFDVACRVKAPPVILSSTYRTMAPAPQKVNASQARIEDVCRLEAVPLQPVSDNLPSCGIDVADSNLVVQPHLVTIDPPATVRWRYQFSEISFGEPLQDF